MRLEILRPLVLLLIPVFLLLLGLGAYFCRAKLQGKAAKSFFFHAAAGTLLVLALCGISIQWQTRAVTTIYIVDLSDSARFYQENAEEFLRVSMEKMPEEESAAVITFGSESRVELFVGQGRRFHRFENIPNRSATNMEEAVSTALALLPADSAKRIVLLTDGFENAGALEDTVTSLVSAEVDVKAVQIEREENDEVYINNLDIPSRISAGDRFSIHVEVISNRSTSAVLYLFTESKINTQVQVELSPGENHFVFEDVQRSNGLVRYRATIDPLDDTESINNVYYSYTNIQSAPQILLIKGEENGVAEFEKLLAAGNINFQTITPGHAPETMDKLLEYKSVVFADVHYDDLPGEFTSLLEAFVKDYGGGVIATGGENSFALGNYRDTPLETVLPVSMNLSGENQVPPIAMALVIDRSGSMSGGDGQVSKLRLAKEAARKALEELRDIDIIGVIGFDDGYHWVSKFGSAAQRDDVTAAISGITEGGGTSIHPALQEAVDAIKTQNAPLKHIILLTDGQDGFRDYAELLDDLTANGITLSTVSVGEDADTDILEYLSQNGGGRYYHTDIRTNIPRIFAQEVYLSSKAYLINRAFTPVVASSHEILQTVDLQTLPSMLGYIAASPKSYTHVLLQSDTGDPILSVWQYGLGRTAAFNSDVKNRWTGNYAGWEPYPALWKNIIDFTTADLAGSGGTVAVAAEGTSAAVTFQTDDYSVGTSVSALYTHEDGTISEFELYPESPGMYRGTFPATSTGVYSINVRKAENGEVVEAFNTIYMNQYSPEYRFHENINVLPYFLDRVSGRLITTPGEVFEGDIQMVHSGVPTANLLLVLAVLIFMTGIAWQRIAPRKRPKKQPLPKPAQPPSAPEYIPENVVEPARQPERAPQDEEGNGNQRKPPRKESTVLNTSALLSRKEKRSQAFKKDDR